MNLTVWAVIDPQNKVKKVYVGKPHERALAAQYYEDHVEDHIGVRLPEDLKAAVGMGYRLARGKLSIDLRPSKTSSRRQEAPKFPFMFLWNESSKRTIERLMRDAGIPNYRIGKPIDGSRGDYGLYVNGRRLNKFKLFLQERGMRTEAHWVDEAAKFFVDILNGV